MRRALIGLLCALISTSCMPVLDGEDYNLAGQEVRLTILHTSDIHSRLIPYDFAPLKTDTDLGIIPEAGPFGGATRMAALLKRERQRGDRVMHLDSGDCFQGAPIFNLKNGEAEFRFLTAAGLDAAVVGNHEFDAGALNFVEKARDFAQFPLLAANYAWDSPNDPGNNGAALVTAPYTIRMMKGLRVGVIGMANLSSLNSIVEGGNSLQVTPLEQNEALRGYVDLLRPVTDLIVVVSHLGLTEDQDAVLGYEAYFEYERAKPFIDREKNPWKILEWSGEEGNLKSVVRVQIPGVSGIDIILGGHLHVVLNPPQSVIDPSGRTVLLTHSGAFSKYVGRLDVVVKVPKAEEATVDGAELVSHDYRAFPLDALWCDDAMRAFYHDDSVFWEPGTFVARPDVRAAMKKCEDQEDRFTTGLLQEYILGMDFNLQLTSIFSYAPRDVARRNSSTGGDSPLGNVAADSMRKRRRVEAEMAITNSLGIRDNLYAGVVSQESMFNVFPFENTINIMYLSGVEVQEMFDFVAERSAERGCVSQAQVSGARFTMDCAQVQLNELRIACNPDDGGASKWCPKEGREGHAPWQCLEDLDGSRCWANPAIDIQINGKPLDPNGTYRIAVNDYIAKGGSGFRVLKRNTTRIETGISLRDSLIGYMQSQCTCEDILLGNETSSTGERCGTLVNGKWVVDEQTRGFCREAKAFKQHLAVTAGSCTCRELLGKTEDVDDLDDTVERCGVSAETIQTTCTAGQQDKAVGSCTCGELTAAQKIDVDDLDDSVERCGASAEKIQELCTVEPGPYTGRCGCRDALAGNNPTCGTLTPQLRNFCENPTSMPIANVVEDGRIGRRVK
ncbi:bifunctional metallophosphatase/5'-nucleotidase [Hyalangium rubrum]|uniref:Bifunctional UDP-sugar hydrolase/5'-nucleotidase n=1 Tax=Hyalangium rubrum TaxID=3103134 RepID=A0ABU5GVJ8_9BACT|nr:bifunctional UDP-sugar hydrolase/5'-nucleotidase [Hyalangium sp. s54d21]MDY7225212.1 bifunctional UDP-sugar hydrolase/5'-nucleotidase [Hyalangium sp. s54d21]